MSRPRDFLLTFATPTVSVGPLACTGLLPEHEENEMVSTAKATATTTAYGERRIKSHLFRVCVMVLFTSPLPDGT